MEQINSYLVIFLLVLVTYISHKSITWGLICMSILLYMIMIHLEYFVNKN